MDIVCELPQTSTSYDVIVVFVDKLSKMIYIQPTTKNVTTLELARIYLEAVYSHHGMSKVLISNRGTQFTSMFWKSLSGLFKTKLAMSMAYHPKRDGQTKQANHTIKDMLHAFTLEEHDEWDWSLPMVEFSYNNSLNASTKSTPFFLMYGEHPTVPTKFTRYINQAKGLTKVAATDDFVQRTRRGIFQAQEKLIIAQNRQKQYVDAHLRDVEFAKGDKV